MQAEMGWLPAKFRRLLNMIRFWNRMMKMPNDSLTKQMFNTDYMLANANDNWSKSVRDIFITLGNVDIHDNKSECNIITFL
jgi:predicted proteasome-type protease